MQYSTIVLNGLLSCVAFQHICVINANGKKKYSKKD